MLINREIFSVPPFISTSWGHVVALHMSAKQLIVILNDGTTIKIPDLASEVIAQIFAMHAAYLEEQSKRERSVQQLTESAAIEFPFRLNFSCIEGMATALQHNPEQGDMPDLPAEMLNKIGAIAKLAGLSDHRQVPAAEPHCNCLHCQITRAIHQSIGEIQEGPALEAQITSASGTEALSVDEHWVIEPGEDKRYYKVHDSHNPEEVFTVYLGEDQVGCNCGVHGCEHIKAVLRS